MRQEVIKDWFNKTYATRGTQYLRPKEAYYIFLELLETEPDKLILDVACGTGQLLKIASEYKLGLFGLDISDVAIEIAKNKLPNANFISGNAESLPYPDNTFDYVSCLGSLERMLDLDLVLKEQYRVGKENAKYCYMVRNSERTSWKWIKKNLGIINKKGHQGAKSLEEWTKIFEKNHFVIDKIHHDQWPSIRWDRWFSLNDKLFNVDYKKISKNKNRIETAYEFIFVLSKSEL